MGFFLRDKVTKEEYELINGWINYENCEGIRKYFYGLTVQDKFKNQAILLDDMLHKYDSGLDKNEPIYRGLRFNKNVNYKLNIYEETKNMLYEAYKNDGLIKIDEAPSSFTRDINIAFNEFAWNESPIFKSIVYILIDRTSNELYLKGFSDKFAKEEEIVLKSHKAVYVIVSITINEYDTLIVELKEHI